MSSSSLRVFTRRLKKKSRHTARLFRVLALFNIVDETNDGLSFLLSFSGSHSVYTHRQLIFSSGNRASDAYESSAVRRRSRFRRFPPSDSVFAPCHLHYSANIRRVIFLVFAFPLSFSRAFVRKLRRSTKGLPLRQNRQTFAGRFKSTLSSSL